MGAGDLVFAGRFEGQASSKQLIESDADGVDIGARVELFAQDLFGRHEGQRAQDHARSCELGAECGERQSEIEKFNAIVAADHDVGGFDVAMHDAAIVGVGEAREDLLNVVKPGRESHWGGAEFGAQGKPLDEFHDHDKFAVVTKGGVEFGDIRVVEAGEQLDFAEKASNDFVGDGTTGGEDLHGLGSIGYGVADLVDLAHSSCAEDACDFVVADLVPDGDGHALSTHFTGFCGN